MLQPAYHVAPNVTDRRYNLCRCLNDDHWFCIVSSGVPSLLIPCPVLRLCVQGDEDDPETGVESSFRVERPNPPRALTLFQLREAFPFIGTFHFRLKVGNCSIQLGADTQLFEGEGSTCRLPPGRSQADWNQLPSNCFGLASEWSYQRQLNS